MPGVATTRSKSWPRRPSSSARSTTSIPTTLACFRSGSSIRGISRRSKVPKVTLEGAGQSGDRLGLRRLRCRSTRFDLPHARRGNDCAGQLSSRAWRRSARSPSTRRYQLVFKNAEGQQNPQPVRHQIEVTRDQPPEIQFVGADARRNRTAARRGRRFGSRGQRSRLRTRRA